MLHGVSVTVLEDEWAPRLGEKVIFRLGIEALVFHAGGFALL